MTTPATSPENGAQTDADEQTGTPEGGSTLKQENGSEAPKGNREARYRVERNEAREALSQAEARVLALQTRELHRLAGEHLAQPEDLLTLGGVELAELLDEDGNVDPEAVADAAADLIESRPGLAKNPRVLATDISQGRSGAIGKGQPTWDDLFRDH